MYIRAACFTPSPDWIASMETKKRQIMVCSFFSTAYSMSNGVILRMPVNYSGVKIEASMFSILKKIDFQLLNLSLVPKVLSSLKRNKGAHELQAYSWRQGTLVLMSSHTGPKVWDKKQPSIIYMEV